jgi:uncharacterized membrane protein YfcA
LITFILILLVILSATYAFIYISAFRKNRDNLNKHSWAKFLVIGLVTDFLDTLGIGNFALTAAAFKLGGLVEDRLIPGTMNAAHCLPVVTEALIFMKVIHVEPITLVTMLASSVVGAVFGASIVSKLNVRTIRIAMGTALFAVAFILLAGLMQWMPSGGEAVGLTGWKLIFAVGANFVLGALMTIGIGQYAPCMALVYSLGMSPKVAFPIMMGSCAFLMPAASMKFVKAQAVDLKAAMGITIGGIVGVLIAAYLITSLPLTLLKWVVFFVLLYTAVSMLRAGLKSSVLREAQA